jgi:hypothetical protein
MKSHITSFPEVEAETVSKMVEIHFMPPWLIAWEDFIAKPKTF